MKTLCKVGCCLALIAGMGAGARAAEYTAETSATKWSEIAPNEWSPSEFVSDAASTATVTTTASEFALDSALTADLLRIRSGGQDLSVTMPVKPTVLRMAKLGFLLLVC